MALPYEGDTEFGRNGAYSLTEHGEEVKPIAVKPRSSPSEIEDRYGYEEDEEPRGCWERTSTSCSNFFAMICPSCMSSVPSAVLILLAVLLALFVILSIPLIFALTYSQSAAHQGEQPGFFPGRIPQEEFPWPDGEFRDEDFMYNATLPLLEALLPANVSKCMGMGFSCANSPGTTVGTNVRCDGFAQCSDGSDESNCQECQTSFSCPINGTKNFKCFRAVVLCDGIPQCEDHSDEKFCDFTTCPSDKFQCLNSNMCLPKSFVCDGESHCEDSSDEKDCKGKCQNGAKWCKESNTCIAKWKLRDGIINCPGGSDEDDCNCKTCSGFGKMLCKKDENEGFCVLQDKICDGVSDCPGDIDEIGCPPKNDTVLHDLLRTSLRFV